MTIKIVKDTLMGNGKSYAMFEGGWILYQRYENGSVYFYDSIYEQEYLLFDFNATPNSLIATYVRGNDTTDVYYYGVRRDSLKYLGTKDSLWHFYVDWNRQYLDEEAIYFIADSIGISWMYGFMWGYFLTGAIISNDTIGVVSNISKSFNNYHKDFHLAQNYPNPFNPSTTIEFTLPKSEFVELKVYNILGKEVSTLVSTKLNQGNHTYTFDGKNLASGIYYYQLLAGDYREVKKMILLR